MIEKRPQNVFTKIQRRVAVKLQSTECAAVSDLLTVMPWTHHQKHFVIVRVLRFDRFVNRDRSIDVFLIPQTMDQHHGHLQRLFRQKLVDCLLAPTGIVARMFQQLSPEASLFQSSTLSQLSRRTRLHKHIVIIKVAGPPVIFIRARAVLLINVGHVLLTKRTIVKPVVTHPSVHHWIHRHGDFQRRMRIHQGHQRQKTVI